MSERKRIKELEKKLSEMFTAKQVLGFVDNAFHCFASDYRTKAQLSVTRMMKELKQHEPI